MGMVVVPVIGDGNCLPRSLVVAVENAALSMDRREKLSKVHKMCETARA